MAEDRDLTKAERIFVRISVMQTILAVVGLFTGAVALYATLNEADAVRKQQEAAVWPLVQMAISDFDVETKQPILRISARNAGIGPARILAFRVRVDGVAKTTWDDVFTTLAGSHDNVLKSYFSGRVVSPGEEVNLALARDSVARTALDKVYGGSSRLEWDVCYCSVFDKCWTSSSQGQSWLKAATPVKMCPDYGDEQFQG
ncbi:MAG: hypothetical protein VX640_07625 [Pseudomonadota bacterium]|nr:hypothetical protein [Pseudomonadota bacterium]